jgi:hypothetical protein
MHAQKFHGNADGEGCVIDAADDGTPFPDLIGWECWARATLYANREAAERCCAPDPGADTARVHTGEK